MDPNRTTDKPLAGLRTMWVAHTRGDSIPTRCLACVDNLAVCVQRQALDAARRAGAGATQLLAFIALMRRVNAADVQREFGHLGHPCAGAFVIGQWCQRRGIKALRLCCAPDGEAVDHGTAESLPRGVLVGRGLQIQLGPFCITHRQAATDVVAAGVCRCLGRDRHHPRHATGTRSVSVTGGGFSALRPRWFACVPRMPWGSKPEGHLQPGQHGGVNVAGFGWVIVQPPGKRHTAGHPAAEVQHQSGAGTGQVVIVVRAL